MADKWPTTDDLAARLHAVREDAAWKASCPVTGHGRGRGDRTPSLSLFDGKMLDNGHMPASWKCWAGCDWEAVRDALTAAGHLPRPSSRAPLNGTTATARRTSKTLRGPLLTTYDYLDATGSLVHQTLRFGPAVPGAAGSEGRKSFSQRRPDGNGGWVWNLTGIERVPYRLPDIIAAASGTPIYVVEGEKDADRLGRLGIVATTCAEGAGKWQARYGDWLRDRAVVILPDNDDVGRRHADDVARHLHGIAASVRIVALPDLPVTGDVSDWLDRGHSADDLRAIVAATEPLTAPPARPTSTLPPLPFVRASTIVPREVDWLWPGWLPLGKVVILDGDAGTGKSSITTDWVARVSTGRDWPSGGATTVDGHLTGTPAGAIVVNLEDGDSDTTLPRLMAAGADLTRVDVWPTDSPERFDLSADCIARLEDSVKRFAARLVVIDPLMGVLPEGTNAHRDSDVREALRPMLVMADRLGVTVVFIRHLNKMAGADPLARGTGSVSFGAVARVVLLLAFDPEDTNPDIDARRRVLAPVKMNLGKRPRSLTLGIAGTSVPNGAGGSIDTSHVRWGRSSHHTAATLLAEPKNADRDGDDLTPAAMTLRDILTGGPMSATDAGNEMRAAGFTEGQTRKAANDLGVVRRKVAVAGDPRTPAHERKWQWVWSLPDPAPRDPLEDAVITAPSNAFHAFQPDPDLTDPPDWGDDDDAMEDAVTAAPSTPSISVGPEVEDAAAFYASAPSTPSTPSTASSMHLPTPSIATPTRRVKPDADRRVSFLDIVGMQGLPEGVPS
jgi:putative DNA primase/helicase